MVVLRIYVALKIFQPYRDLGAGDNQSLIRSGDSGIELRTSSSVSQEFNYYSTTVSIMLRECFSLNTYPE